MRSLITKKELTKIEILFGSWLTVVLLSWGSFVAYGYPVLNALFEVVSALTDAGLTMGITVEGMPTLLKLVILFDMLFGKFTVIGLIAYSLPKLLHRHNKK